MHDWESSLPVRLMTSILRLVRESGADQSDALCAIRASEAMLPVLSLGTKPMLKFGTVALDEQSSSSGT